MLTDEEKKERRKVARKKWRDRNKAHISAYDKQHYLTSGKTYPNNAETRKAHIERSNQWAKDNPERHAELSRVNRRRRRDTDPKYRERANAQVRKWRKDNPEKILAQNKLNYRVRTGRIIKPSICSVCGKAKKRIEAHHHKGYAKEHRYDVIWVCRKCHMGIQKNTIQI